MTKAVWSGRCGWCKVPLLPGEDNLCEPCDNIYVTGKQRRESTKRSVLLGLLYIVIGAIMALLFVASGLLA